MIKFFHQLSEQEFVELQQLKMTWTECSEKYPQPSWCQKVDALNPLGCWSLICQMVTGENYCKNCESYCAKVLQPTAPMVRRGALPLGFQSTWSDSEAADAKG